MPPALSADAQNVFRQAMGGLFWSKQFYHYDVRTWLEGDPARPASAAGAGDGTKPHVDSPLQCRRHLHAR